jgi:vesicle coat complex subunit
VTHKNANVREHVIKTISTLYELHGDDMGSVSNLNPKIAFLLSDREPAVRQKALELLIGLHSLYGDAMLVS